MSRTRRVLLSPWVPVVIAAGSCVLASRPGIGDLEKRETAVLVWSTAFAAAAILWALQSVWQSRWGAAVLLLATSEMLVEAAWRLRIGFFDGFWLGLGSGIVVSAGGIFAAMLWRVPARQRLVRLAVGLMPLVGLALSHHANDEYSATARTFCEGAVERIDDWRAAHESYPRTLAEAGVPSEAYVPRKYDGYYSDGEGFMIGYVEDLCRNYARVRWSSSSEWESRETGL